LSIGIYKITNKITNECYIGQSVDIEKRWENHKRLLKRNHHRYEGSKQKSVLQNAWNKYGEDNFEFIIIEECSKEELNNREVYWINYYSCNRNKTGKGYNLNDGGYGSRGYRYTEQDKKKVSLANKGRVHLNNGKEMRFVFEDEVEDFLKKGFVFGELPYSDETKEKVRNASNGNTNVKGRIQINNGKVQKMVKEEELNYYLSIGFKLGMLPETLEKINKNRKMVYGEDHWNYGKKQSDETIKKRSIAMKGKPGWLKGKHLSEEVKIKISKAGKGRKMPKEAIEKSRVGKYKPVLQYDKEGNFLNRYNSGKEAEEKTKVGRSHISQCCKGKRKTAGGFIWRFENE